ncbi:hypothetical protein IWX65_003309 [Arthrobacter sp. CAN_A214]|uniref:hypothetical protein n=1 Tax=Arthrobacter sp. CAN_A214 TaxID=2787720 RepID=UPI0018C9740B
MTVICIAMAFCSVIVLRTGAGSQGGFLANFFPTKYRFSGIAVTRELNAVAVSRPTPLIAAALVVALSGAPWLVTEYLALCGLVTFVAVLAVNSCSAADVDS